MTDQPPPVVILDGSADPTQATMPGWSPHDGFELPRSPWDLASRRFLCRGRVGDQAQAGAAVAALARGAALAIAVDLDGQDKHRFFDDLHHLGSVGPVPTADYDDIESRLLAALAAGETVTAAARMLNISRRTANRHLAGIRDRLGAASTAEAVSRWAAEVR